MMEIHLFVLWRIYIVKLITAYFVVEVPHLHIELNDDTVPFSANVVFD